MPTINSTDLRLQCREARGVASHSSHDLRHRDATRRSFSFSGDGVSYDDAAYNQRTLQNHFFNPGTVTQNQPKAWFKLAYPSGETFIGAFMITSWSDESPEADVQTWSIEATSNGNVVYDDGVA